MSTDSKLRMMAHRYAEPEVRRAEAEFLRRLKCCESPIEQLLLGELIANGQATPICDETAVERAQKIAGATAHGHRFGGIFWFRMPEADEPCGLLIAQWPVGCGGTVMRLDFILGYRTSEGVEASFEIECDGHEYHERTKEQAASDRARDRLLTASGWVVVRFTGSELYADPERCVSELNRIVMTTIGVRSSI